MLWICLAEVPILCSMQDLFEKNLLLCHNWYNLRPIMQDFVEKMNIVCVFVGMAFLLMDLNSGNLNVICLINRLIAMNRENFDETDISECVYKSKQIEIDRHWIKKVSKSNSWREINHCVTRNIGCKEEQIVRTKDEVVTRANQNKGSACIGLEGGKTRIVIGFNIAVGWLQWCSEFKTNRRAKGVKTFQSWVLNNHW